MSLLSFASRLRRQSKVAVFNIQGSRFAFPVGTAVARAPWSCSHALVAANGGAVGYTSFEGELVPVFDLGTKLGLAEKTTGDEVLIVRANDGIAAIVVDRFLGNEIIDTSAKVLDADDILASAVVSLAPAA